MYACSKSYAPHLRSQAFCALRMLLLSALLTMLASSVHAQDFAIKTNLLYDATATVNLGFEAGIAPKWTLDVSANLNAWDMSHNRKWKHWLLQPELRRWTCNRFIGHFFAVHALGGQFNFGNLDNDINLLGSDLSKLSDNRYEGWYIGAGVAYGYAWVLGRHWNLEAEIGVGYIYSHFDRYEAPVCGALLESDLDHHYVGPTKLALNIVYVF